MVVRRSARVRVKIKQIPEEAGRYLRPAKRRPGTIVLYFIRVRNLSVFCSV